VHVIRDWCWLGTARDDGGLACLLQALPPPSFDIDVARLLIGRYAKGALRLTPLPGTARRPAVYEALTTRLSETDFTPSTP
jgi:hypothetical protein